MTSASGVDGSWVPTSKRQKRGGGLTETGRDLSPWSDYPVEDPDTRVTAQDYIFLENLRLVKPYYFDFVANVKQRWWGMTLVDLFAQVCIFTSPL